MIGDILRAEMPQPAYDLLAVAPGVWSGRAGAAALPSLLLSPGVWLVTARVRLILVPDGVDATAYATIRLSDVVRATPLPLTESIHFDGDGPHRRDMMANISTVARLVDTTMVGVEAMRSSALAACQIASDAYGRTMIEAVQIA